MENPSPCTERAHDELKNEIQEQEERSLSQDDSMMNLEIQECTEINEVLSPHVSTLQRTSWETLTLEEIRLGLGHVASSKCSSKLPEAAVDSKESSCVNEKSLVKNFFEEKDRLDNRSDKAAEAESSDSSEMRRILTFCYELLELTSYMEERRVKTAQEWNEKNQAVRQLETLYDSVRERERHFLENVMEQQEKIKQREQKYSEFTKRALVTVAYIFEHLAHCKFISSHIL